MKELRKRYGLKIQDIAPVKSEACSGVLRLMDQDFSYMQAVENILSQNPEIDREELEKELDKYV